MAIVVTEDESSEGGYAFVDLGTTASSPGSKLSFRRQDVEPRHLGPEGWQPEVAWLAPISDETVDGRTVHRYGPEVVDRIEELVPIEIVDEAGSSYGVVAWPYIQPAPPESRVLIGQQSKGPLRLVQPETADRSQPLSEPPPLLASSVGTIVQPASVELPLPELPPQHRATPTVARNRSWLRLALVASLAMLLAVGTAAYVDREELKPLWARVLASFYPGHSQPTAAQLRQDLDGLLQRQALSQDFVSFAERAMEADQPALAFRGFEEADPVGSDQAALQLGRFYDPGSSAETYRRVADVNPTRAAYYYALWRTRSPRAAEDLRTLCGRSPDLLASSLRLRTLCGS